MNILENFNMAVKTLTVNKMRSLLTMLGIIIGNASVIVMVAVGEGAQQFTKQQLDSMGPNQLSVWAAQSASEVTTEATELTLADVEAIQKAPSVIKVAPQISANLQLIYQGRATKASVTGTNPSILYVRNLKVRQGRFFDSTEQKQNAQVVILGAAIASKLFSRENPLSKEIQINNINFQVIGLMQQKGAFLGINYDDAVYIPITTAADQLIARRSVKGITVDFLEVSAKDKQGVRAAAFQINNILALRHSKKKFTVSANKSLQDLVGNITAALSVFLTLIAGISLFVGGIGIMNIMLVSVTERTKEIGLRKAIGAPSNSILTQFLIEAIILSVGGGLIGTTIGVGSAMLVSIFTPLKPNVPISAIFLATSVSGGIGLLFGVAPARQAARLDPIVALRSD
ncbi:ABC transporter permease [Dulcicalothrix desertica PCC 7102]|uniref:ABC transporter permease n=1 Tax=Dulcicalothrix desertica PCC 7102 TaxID=232991 RepID=A0A3S1AS08_9CYAN|nr:ABC transporter permease [Dulcicalothrix desertica]RUT07704.1 ABC transporter permease [Dulcicalothrix desertica PCC 7102]TWH39874.1 putative ABC transport system permease protein [Dulcicalothrix desertica PCC 7102]